MLEEAPCISLTPNGPNRWKLVTPQHKSATLDDAAVIDAQLASGDAWTPSVQERVRLAIGEAGARIAAARLLRVRARSSAELRERLAKRYPKDAVDKAVDGLIRSGAVDDARLAGELAERFGELRPHSREAVRDRLERAKLDEQLLGPALDEHAPAARESERAEEVARAQVRRLETLGLPSEAMRRRLYGVLARRGFDAEVAAEAVERVLGSWDHDADA